MSKRYNDAVNKARMAVKKKDEVETAPIQAEPVKQTSTFVASATELPRAQFIYGRFLLKGQMFMSEITEECGLTTIMCYKAVKALVNNGLVTSEKTNLSGTPLLYKLVADKDIPDGWPTKDELIALAPPEHTVTKIVKERIDNTEFEQEKAKNNPLTKMITKKNVHVFDTTGYETFIKDTSKYYGIKELDDVIGVLHKICLERIQAKHIECPLCKGRIERNGNQAHCTKCGMKIEAGSFEQSLEMFKTLAKSGVTI